MSQLVFCPYCGSTEHYALEAIDCLMPRPLNESKTLGQVNYEGYYEASGGKSLVSGQPLPLWDKQDPKIQSAWEAAAQAVIIHTQEVSKP